MRVLVFHGYMLRGTGSNIYNVNLARALVDLGHEVDLLCQDRDAGDLAFVDAVGDWDEGRLRVRTSREPARCTVYLPSIGRTLPVYVADRYEGFDAVPFAELDDAALERYVAANVDAVRDVVDRVAPDVALANHAVMGPVILARALGGAVPYAVKIHGSALEYTVRPHRERFLPYAREGLAAAAGVLVGSRHTGASLWEVMGEPELPRKTRLGPPGVDEATFRPRDAPAAQRGLEALAARLEAGATATWGGEAEAAPAIRSLDPAEPIVAFVGKLIVSKGIDLLLGAWPLVAERVPSARLCVVGFGTYRDGARRLVRALRDGDIAGARDVAALGRELEGGPPGELAYLAAFLDGLHGAHLDAYRESAAGAFDRVRFTGRLEHSDLPDLLSACAAQVVPSTFPEAFGMVAAEAACCGAFPLSAGHSGLAEVSAALAPALEPALRPLLSFELGRDAVQQLATRLADVLALDPAVRVRAAASLSDLARRKYSWASVAEGVIAAAHGRLSELPEPGSDAMAPA